MNYEWADLIQQSKSIITKCGLVGGRYAPVSRVLFLAVISLGLAAGYLVASVAALNFRPARRATSHAQCAQRSFRRLLQGGLPFSLHGAVASWLWSLLLSPPCGGANLDCQGPRPALPPLSRGTLLYAARTFLCPLGQRPPGTRIPCPTHLSCIAPEEAFVKSR